MFNITLGMMDVAKRYIEASGETTFKIQVGKGDDAYWTSITLDLRTKEANPKAGREVRKQIINETLTKVNELL